MPMCGKQRLRLALVSLGGTRGRCKRRACHGGWSLSGVARLAFRSSLRCSLVAGARVKLLSASLVSVRLSMHRCARDVSVTDVWTAKAGVG